MKPFVRFPHTCRFYREVKDPNDFYGNKTEVESYNGSCDIQINSEGLGNVAIKSKLTINIPLQNTDDPLVFNIRIGDKFEGYEYGIKRVGTVLDFTISQLGFASIFIESVGVV